VSVETDPILFQWNFFERTISNYSVILKIFQCLEDGDSLVKYMPRVFVEETAFDACQIVAREDDSSKTGFSSLDECLKALSFEEIECLDGTSFAPSVLNNEHGYGTLWLYPLRDDVEIFGYLLLGKKDGIDLGDRSLVELKLLADILNRSLLLSKRVREARATKIKAAAEAPDGNLAMTRVLLENVIDQFPHIVLVVDRKGRITFANTKARTELCEQKGLIIGERLDAIISGLDADFLEKDAILQGDIHYRVNGSYRYYSLESYPIKDGEGTIVWKSVVLKDVMGERVTEEENLHRGKMESMGRLAGGVAHDFNNLLTGVLGYASLIKRFLTDNAQLYRYAEVIESSARRAAVLTQHLLNFSRRQKRSVGVMDVNTLLDDVLFLVKESFGDVTINHDFDQLLPPIRGDEAELQHAFLNLCINSKDAMPNGGTLTVRTERKRYIGDREFVLVEIEDTGCGMDEATRKHIFEPFFTTKSKGTKLGMGLYLFDKVIRSHDGFIELASEPGKGSRFSIYLPVDTRIKETRPSAEPDPETTKDATVLIVDDEDVIRELLAGVLRRGGFKVLEAGDGKSALSVFEEHKDKVDLVVLDMIMPGLKGEEVLKRLRILAESVRVVVSSGFMSEEQRGKLQHYHPAAFLDKPYRDEDVLRTIRQALANGKS
jgi:two-component system, cell cycle sensor histidine kinase and response regulator CckA